MKITIGDSKNEHRELFVSIIFIAIAGFIASFLVHLDSNWYLTLTGTIFLFGIGIIFALRVSGKISYNHQMNKQKIEKLEDGLKKAKDSLDVLDMNQRLNIGFGK